MPKRRRQKTTTRVSFHLSDPSMNLDWSCPLLCQQCTHLRPNGEQCKNRVCVGHPFCWVHIRAKYGVKVQKSNIPGAGKGLFATRDIKKNTWICPYIGEVIDAQCLEQRYPGGVTAPYAEEMPLNVSPKLYTDSACWRSVGSMANAIFKANGAVASMRQHNCITRYRPVGEGFKGIWLKSTKNIKAGTEILNWYGDGGYELQSNHTTKRRTKVPDSRPCRP